MHPADKSVQDVIDKAPRCYLTVLGMTISATRTEDSVNTNRAPVSVPLPISTWTASSAVGVCSPDLGPARNQKLGINTHINVYDNFYPRNRERLPWGAGGGNERPCSPARRRRHPDRMSPRRPPSSGIHGSPPPSGPEARWGHGRFGPTHSKDSCQKTSRLQQSTERPPSARRPGRSPPPRSSPG